MQLLERRPLHGFFSVGPPPADGFNVLKVATEVLEASLAKRKDQSLNPWGWFTWGKWYALAIVLSELCGPSVGSEVDRAWAAAEASFSSYTAYTLDARLWSSIEKLMSRTRSARHRLSCPEDPLSSAVILPRDDTDPITHKCDHNDYGTEQSSAREHYNDDQIGLGTPFNELPLLHSYAQETDMLIDAPEGSQWLNWEWFVQDMNLIDPSVLEQPFVTPA